MNRKHRVEEYFAGALDERTHAEFERHLQACAACQEGLEQLKRLDARLATSLRQPLALREPRPEWMSSMRDQFRLAQHPAEHPTRWLAFGSIPAFAVIVLVLLVTFHPWGRPVGSEERLDRVYSTTLQESFRGQFTIIDGTSAAMSGTFAHSPGGSWATSAEHTSGQRIEEVEVEGQIWRRNNGGWMLDSSPLYVSPRNVTIIRLPDLLRAVTALTDVQPVDADTYVGADPQYLARLRENVLSPEGLENVWMEDIPPQVEVEVTNGKIREMRLIFHPPDGALIIATIVFEEYGSPVQITKPMEPSPP